MVGLKNEVGEKEERLKEETGRRLRGGGSLREELGVSRSNFTAPSSRRRRSVQARKIGFKGLFYRRTENHLSLFFFFFLSFSRYKHIIILLCPAR